MRARVVVPLLSAALISGALVTAAHAAAPAPVGPLHVTTGVTDRGRPYVQVSWESEDPSAAGARVCLAPPNVDPNDMRFCSPQQDVAAPATTSRRLMTREGWSYRISVYAYDDQSPRAYAPATSVTWHGSKLKGMRTPVVRYGERVQVHTVLTDAKNDNPIGDRMVKLWSRADVRGAEWRKDFSGRTRADGSIRTTVRPTRNRLYQWRFGGAPGLLAGTRVVTVWVQPVLTAHLTTTSARPGATVKIYGRVKPRSSELRVWLLQYGPHCSGYAFVPQSGTKVRPHRQRLPNGVTAYGYVISFSRPAGTYKLRTGVTGDRTLSYAESATRRLLVSGTAATASTQARPAC